MSSNWFQHYGTITAMIYIIMRFWISWSIKKSISLQETRFQIQSPGMAPQQDTQVSFRIIYGSSSQCLAAPLINPIQIPPSSNPFWAYYSDEAIAVTLG